MAIGLKIVNGDVVFNTSGSLEFITPGVKCARDFGKFLSTDQEFESNQESFYRYNPDYGTELDNRNLYLGLSRLAIRDTITKKLNEAINWYLRLQEGRINLNIEEIIASVKFDVYYDDDNPAQLNIDINYTDVQGDSKTLGEYQQLIG